ncbi:MULTISPECIES: hypothetical protein [Massilia]|uniref:hypothetical protein n=1 Tax=Massilia TaxID=149698 RepID=UPI002796C754|nr:MULTISPECIES: hypothetical protein [unclassified Massilia]MDQ1835627.1 hypothetical protein [Massilia sp. CCM 9029]MDQ1925046.1 hypothetical protein [Massilia sp. CCM 9206]
MNNLSLSVEVLGPSVVRVVDRINFSQTAFVVPAVDSDIDALLKSSEGLIVAEELIRSLDGSGRYLIFTSASGIADESGWEGVEVSYLNEQVSWLLEYNDTEYRWFFSIDSYRSEIEKIRDEISDIPQGVKLEPSQVIFPEDW